MRFLQMVRTHWIFWRSMLLQQPWRYRTYPGMDPLQLFVLVRIDGEFVLNPTFEEIAKSDLDLRLAGTRDAVLMVEAGANEVAEDVMVTALEFGQAAIQPIIATIDKMATEIGKSKRDYPSFGTS